MFTPPSQVRHSLSKPDRVKRVSVQELMSRYVGITDDQRPRKRKATTCGKRTKMGIQAYMAMVLESNELIPRTKKLTNAGIELMLCQEFAHHAPLIKKVKESRGHIVNYYRHRYNQGLLTGSAPPSISFRYNEQGIAVEPRYGKCVLTTEEKAAVIDKYRTKFREIQERNHVPNPPNDDSSG